MHAVFFHDENDLNEGLALADAYTSQRADLHAALHALKLAKRIRQRNKRGPCPPRGPYRKLRRVVLKTNSMYLVEAMTEHIHRWNANGYINAKGQNVVNEDLFRKLDDAVEDLEDSNVVVQFWHVSKRQNEDAHDLANEALDEADREKRIKDALEDSKRKSEAKKTVETYKRLAFCKSLYEDIESTSESSSADERYYQMALLVKW